MAVIRLGDLARDYPSVPRSHIRALLSHILLPSSAERGTLLQDLALDETQERILRESLQRLQEGVPLSRIIGIREFWSLPFHLNEATLDPRPDSETLIEAVLTFYPDKKNPYKILDLGTGSGCLLIALLTEYAQATGVGVDLSDRALEAATHNARLNNVSHRSSFIESHWTAAVQGSFDIILSNPPYISNEERSSLAPGVLRYDPPLALFADDKGLKAYKDIMEALSPFLAPGGKAFFEIGRHQEKAVKEIADQAGLAFIQSFQDLQGIPRCLVFGKSSKVHFKKTFNLSGDV